MFPIPSHLFALYLASPKYLAALSINSTAQESKKIL